MGNPTISNTLYHFTGFGGEDGKTSDESFETLKKILSSSVLLLSRNDVEWGYTDSEGKKVTGVSFSPYMVCFTETPLGFANDHIRDFGNFGIGFDIDWVISNKGQNVVYVQDGNVNHLGETISKMLMHLVIDKQSKDFPRKRLHELVYITENMNWRNEREWRIVDDKEGQVAFTFENVKEIVCPKEYQEKLIAFLKSDCKFNELMGKVASQ